MRLFTFFILLIAMIGCEKAPEVRQYSELHSVPTKKLELPKQQQTNDPMMQKMLNDSVASVELTWETPSGWVEQKGSGMRLTTFMTEGSDPIQCTLISLGGMAGGVEGNVRRWLNQIGISLDDQALLQFIQESDAVQTGLGQDVPVFDLASLQEAGAPSSMVASIIALDAKMLFVKMTGSQAAVTANKEKFIQLIESLNH